MKNLEIRLFRFDKDKDYEAYYKPYIYENKFETLFDLLKEIKKDDIYFDFEEDINSHIKIFDDIYKLDIKINQLTQKYNVLKINPLDKKRSYKDLLINKDDFLSKFELVKNLVNQEDKKIYEKYDFLYYASDIREFLPNYLGDALFVFVYDMIKKYPENKDKFLKIISNKENGIMYHIPLKDEFYEDKIQQLEQILIKENLLNINTNENLLNINAFDEQYNEQSSLKYDFKDFSIGLYKTKINNKNFKAKFINIKEKNNGFKFIKSNPNLSYIMASNIVLNAYDSGCDFLVVDSKEDFYMFDTCAKDLMKQSNRDFEDFYILSKNEFLNLAINSKSLTLKNHTLKVTLI